MTADWKFVEWIADRLVTVYGESPNVDFVQKLRRISKRLICEDADFGEELDS